MAFFRKKPPADADSSPENADNSFVPQPEKAKKWFDHGRNASDTYNYKYALTCYANGIKLDPYTLTAHDLMLEAALKYMNKGGKPAAGKEIREIEDGTKMSKFATAEFAWMKDIKNGSLAIKAMEQAAKAELGECGAWMSPHAMNLLRGQPKITKAQYIQAKDLFIEFEAWDQALDAGKHALALDPANGSLDAELKNLAAQRAMTQGGYEESAGQEGGFRAFVKDAEKQQELVEEESISGASNVEERNLARARAEYEKNPTVADLINTYGQLLKKPGTDEALAQALALFTKGFADTNEYRFRMIAVDIQITQRRRTLEQLEKKLEDSPEDAALQEQVGQAQKELLDFEAEAYEERTKKYPTDRVMKYEYGTVLLKLNRYEDAMGCFQASKDEPKLRVRAGHWLGRCFAAEGWHMEAIEEYKEAIHAIDVGDPEVELGIRYDLMVSLVAHARDENSVEIAREAKGICSEIARKNITYRDIRAKRKEVDEVIKELG